MHPFHLASHVTFITGKRGGLFLVMGGFSYGNGGVLRVSWTIEKSEHKNCDKKTEVNY